MIDAAPTGELLRCNAPLLVLAIVDQMIGAHGFEALQLLIRGRGCNDRSPRRLGELKGKDRDAAGALHQNRVPGLQIAIGHQSAPSCQACAGQGRGLCVAIALGRVGEGGGGHGHNLTGKAVGAITGDMAHIGQVRIAIGPVGEEGADDIIAHCKLADALADGCHHTRAIRHGDAALRGRDRAEHDHIVVIVQRAGMDADGDLTPARGGGLCRADREIIQPAGLFEANSFHGRSSGSVPTDLFMLSTLS